MPDLFGHYYGLTVGQPGQPGLLFKTHDLKFEVLKTANSSADKAKFQVYGLSRVDRKRIETLKNQAVVFDVGYQQQHGVIFKGKLDQAYTVKDGDRLVTHIAATDFSTDLARVIAIEIKGDTSARTVINKVANALGIKIGNLTLKNLKDPKVKEEPLYEGGRKVLDDICLNLGLYWHITDGMLYLAPIGTASRQEVTIIKPGTGLVGSPQPTTTGVKGRCLLIPSLQPGSLIKVNSRDVKDKDAILVKCKYFGQKPGADWYVDFESLYRKAALA